MKATYLSALVLAVVSSTNCGLFAQSRELNVAGLKVGAEGRPDSMNAKVMQVIDGNRMLVGIEDSRTADGDYDTWIMLRCPTAGITDDKVWKGADWKAVIGSGYLKVTGTVTYVTAIGGSKTVFTAEGLSPAESAKREAEDKQWREKEKMLADQKREEERKLADRKREEERKLADRKREEERKLADRKREEENLKREEAQRIAEDAKWRQWKIGEEEAFAGKFIQFNGDGVNILRRDTNQSTAFKMAALTKEDQQWVKDEIQRRRDRFIGRWRIIDEKGATAFYLTITKSLQAQKSHAPTATGKCELIGDEARITWSDKWRDLLRPHNSSVQKVAFSPTTSWDDPPANVQRAVKESDDPAPKPKVKRR
ncbi:MAG: hypothetical protein SH850_05480 [Planctomycetaceae bacterium]|nr:hypothetical protein [Planctomycetaceae bacterium]